MAFSSSSNDGSTRFQCVLTNGPEKELTANNENVLWLEQEEGKKSSFVWRALDDTTKREITKPSHLLIQTSSKSTFLFGGLEIVTNARNIEFYLTGENDDDGKETYLTTSRGLQVANEDDAHRFKCLVVCPGGPRPVTRVHLKLLSLKPASCTSATLYLLKFKGRLPPPKQQQQQEEVTRNDVSRQQAATQPAAAAAAPVSPGLTQADVSHAMTGTSLLVRSVETSLQQSIQDSLDKMQQHFDARFNRLEQYMVLQQQQQQQDYTEMQNQLMNQMKEQHGELMTLMGSMNAQQLATAPQERNDSVVEQAVVVKDEASNLNEDARKEGVDSDNEEPINENRAAEPVAIETPQKQATDSKIDEAATKEEADAEDTEDDAQVKERTQCEMQEEDYIEQDSRAVEEEECNDKAEGGANDDDAAALDLEAAEKKSDVDQAEREVVVVKDGVKDDVVGNSDDAAVVQADSEPTAETETSDDTIGQDSDDKQELPTETDEADSTSLPDEHTESASDAAVPEKRPVMENRDDAIEIPDLLSDFTERETNQDENDDQESPP